MNNKIFISYSQNDKAQADAVCSRLESASMNCWIAPRDISPSRDWAEEIIDAINSAAVMVFIFSSSSNTSPQVRREIERAVHKGVNVLPFRIEDVTPSKSLEYFISTQHWLDACTGSFDNHLDELYNCVKAITEGKEAPCAQVVPEPEPVAVEESKSNTGMFSASDLKHFSDCLANHLGPMAKIIVNKKSSQSTSLKDLVNILSDEIDNEKERDNFIQACQPIVSNAPP